MPFLAIEGSDAGADQAAHLPGVVEDWASAHAPVETCISAKARVVSKNGISLAYVNVEYLAKGVRSVVPPLDWWSGFYFGAVVPEGRDPTTDGGGQCVECEMTPLVLGGALRDWNELQEGDIRMWGVPDSLYGPQAGFAIGRNLKREDRKLSDHVAGRRPWSLSPGPVILDDMLGGDCEIRSYDDCRT
jgi:hypothetical protein